MSDLRAELEAIRDRCGLLSPRLVVAEARAGRAPVAHDKLIWDNEVAGERYREQQAHELIRSVRVVYREATGDEPERTIRAYHAFRTGNGFVYEPAEKVATDPVLTAVLLADMRREWETLKARYGHFEEFLEMVRSTVGV